MFGSSEESPTIDRISVLQRQSWQLELIITGFALAGMISGADSYNDFIIKWRDILSNYGSWGTILRGLLKGTFLAYFVVIFHFFLNVVVRSLWIGALALRGVIGKEDYLDQRYHPIFDQFLRRRNGSFDDYINRLDTTASLIFAITFLLITILFGVIVWGSVLAVIVSSFDALFGDAGLVVGILISMAYLLLSVVYLFDFITGGMVKRGESKIYYPLYRLLGWLTLARLYRPLYYVVISNKWGKRLVWLVIPYVMLIIIVPGRVPNFNSYLNRLEYDAEPGLQYAMKDQYYQDKDGYIATKAVLAISSEIITDRVLKVSIPLYEKYHKTLEANCFLFNETLSQESGGLTRNINDTIPIDSYEAGKKLGELIIGGSSRELLPNEDSLLISCLLRNLILSLDEEPANPENAMLSISTRGNPLPELLVYFPLHHLSPGMHRLHLSVRKTGNSSLLTDGDYTFQEHTIPFFYAPE